MPSTSTTSLSGRSFLRELDFTPAEWSSLVDLARVLKAERVQGREVQRLVGRTLALVFEKTSTRTRCAFEVAAYHQGAHVTMLDPAGSQIGHKESVADTARVLGRFFDGIEYRGTAQETVETMARYAGVPVWNGLTDDWHPTQALCDSVTMLEHAGKPAEDIAFAYVGDDFYPGTTTTTEAWPGVGPGDRGVLNTMTPGYFDTSGIADIADKPPITWVRAMEDQGISDTSSFDLAMLGQLGAVPGWPGAEVMPPQPMHQQIQRVLDRYAANGGQVRVVTLENCAHGVPTEDPQAIADAIATYL